MGDTEDDFRSENLYQGPEHDPMLRRETFAVSLRRQKKAQIIADRRDKLM